MLSGNARKPFLEIARETNVSGAAIHQRIQKLTSSGAIKGFESIINPSTAGYETCAYIGFILNDPTSYQKVVDRLHDIPEIVECHFTTGQYDLRPKSSHTTTATFSILSTNVCKVSDALKLSSRSRRFSAVPCRLPILILSNGRPVA